MKIDNLTWGGILGTAFVAAIGGIIYMVGTPDPWNKNPPEPKTVCTASVETGGTDRYGRPFSACVKEEFLCPPPLVVKANAHGRQGFECGLAQEGQG